MSSRPSNFCRKWWMRFPFTATPLSPTKARSRGFLNSVTDGTLHESLAGSAVAPSLRGAAAAVEPPYRLVTFVSSPAEDHPQSKLFDAFSRELLKEGNAIRFQARGASMSPAIRDGEMVHVEPAALADLRVGDIVLVKGEMGFRLHRLVVADAGQDVFITRGDCASDDDPAVSGEEIIGRAEAKDVRIAHSMVRARLKGFTGRFWCCTARAQRIATRLLDQ